MKKLILLAVACLTIVISSCNQNSPAPAPATSSSPTPTPTTTATSSMTATEAKLVGDWIWDKHEVYSSGNLYTTVDSTTQPLYAGSHMVLKSSLFNNTVYTPQYFDADYYGVPAGSGFWNVAPTTYGDALQGMMFYPFATGAGANGYIITLNATTLIYQGWIPGQIANGNKVFLHK